jgi:hypothetical protein
MNLIDFIVSINKISLIAFIGTFVFVGYEVYLLQKEKKSKTQPIIPNFNENLVVKNQSTIQALIDNSRTGKIVKTNPIILIILLILMLLFGIMSIIGFISVRKNSIENVATPLPTPQVIYKKANGVKIFDQNLNILADKELAGLKPAAKILIGIDKISGTDIDKARIRVNKNLWELSDITEKFDSSRNMFYIEYIVASSESKLKIEAQLHSKTDGWLGN